LVVSVIGHVRLDERRRHQRRHATDSGRYRLRPVPRLVNAVDLLVAPSSGGGGVDVAELRTSIGIQPTELMASAVPIDKVEVSLAHTYVMLTTMKRNTKEENIQLNQPIFFFADFLPFDAAKSFFRYL
jgi:hypothetical protein